MLPTRSLSLLLPSVHCENSKNHSLTVRIRSLILRLCLVSSICAWNATPAAFLAGPGSAIAQEASDDDLVEFLNGSRLTGKILQIRKADKEFDFKCEIAGKQVEQTLPYAKVHAVTFGGKRFVLTPKPTDAAMAASGDVQRSPAEVRERIDSVGSSEPDWFASTPLNHPKSLDLDWPLKADGPWNESKNVGQYIWGRVNPNVSRWKPGIKLVYECMALHEGDAALLERDWIKLGGMYFNLLQDYERAAYWLEKAKVQPNTPGGVHLAECYWRLGSEELANKALRGRNLHFSAIKLLGDMGNSKRAMQILKAYENTSVCNEAWLAAGDALRSAGKLDAAIAQYQKVLDHNKARNQEYLKRYRGQAAEAIEAIRLFDSADVSRVADGSYTASATGYNGPIDVEVTVADGKITSVKVIKHNEKQFYAALTDTPNQILQKQGFSDIDATSGATITSLAIVNATARAMSQGAK